VRELTNVFVICDGGGYAALFADAIEGAGYRLPKPSPALAARLLAICDDGTPPGNPFEMAGARDDDPLVYARLLEAALLQDEHDAIVLAGYLGGISDHVGTGLVPLELETVRTIADLVRNSSRPVVLQSTVATNKSELLDALREGGVTCVEWPEEVAAVLRTYGRPTSMELSPSTADGEVASRDLADLTEAVVDTFEQSGVPHALGRRVEREDLAAIATGRWVLRLDGFSHKTRTGAILVDVPAEELEQAHDQLAAVAAREGIEPIVRLGPLIPHDQELILTVWRGPEGTGIVVGEGGTAVEQHADLTIGRIPQTDVHVVDLMSRSAAGRRVLAQHDGVSRLLAEVVLGITDAFVNQLPNLRELECNPIAIGPDGPVVLDVLPTASA
jgi:acyl-CoA synthetase (NDP forming)